MSLPVTFSSEIKFGDILLALIIAGSMSGWALWGYSAIEAQIADDRASIRLMQQRQTQFEIALKQVGDDQRAFNLETRGSLKEIANAIADLRTVVAAKTR